MDIAQHFTFGFEIEGAFHLDLLKKLVKKCKKDKLLLSLQSDGSVRINPPLNLSWIVFGKSLPLSFCRSTSSYELHCPSSEKLSEVTLGIFPSKKMMQEYLAFFENNLNYLSNNTCGFHLHIGTKTLQGRHYLARLLSYPVILDLQKFASTLCPHVKARLKDAWGSRYCRIYKESLKEVFRSFETQEDKYRFVHRHRKYKTMEFRFFSACEHKTANVKQFLAYLFARINREKDTFKATFPLPNSSPSVPPLAFFRKCLNLPTSFALGASGNSPIDHREETQRVVGTPFEGRLPTEISRRRIDEENHSISSNLSSSSSIFQ